MTDHKPLKQWDAADYLESKEAMALYLNACIDEDPGDGSLVRAARSDIARAQNRSRVATNPAEAGFGCGGENRPIICKSRLC